MNEKIYYTLIKVDVSDNPTFVADRFLLATQIYLSIPTIDAAHKIAALAEIPHYRIVREKGFEKITVFESPEIAAAARVHEEKVIRVNKKRDAAVAEINMLPEHYYKNFQFGQHLLSVRVSRSQATRKNVVIPHVIAFVKDDFEVHFLSKNGTKYSCNLLLFNYVYERGVIDRTLVLQRKKFAEDILSRIQRYGGSGITDEDLSPVLPWIVRKNEEARKKIEEVKEKHLGGEV